MQNFIARKHCHFQAKSSHILLSKLLVLICSTHKINVGGNKIFSLVVSRQIFPIQEDVVFNKRLVGNQSSLL